jgi:hypothetical protein
MPINEWVTDLTAMTCRNTVTKIVVVFEQSGKSLTGKIKDIPIELFAKWAGEPHGERHIERVVLEAEEAFLKAYFEEKMTNL